MPHSYVGFEQQGHHSPFMQSFDGFGGNEWEWRHYQMEEARQRRVQEAEAYHTGFEKGWKACCEVRLGKCILDNKRNTAVIAAGHYCAKCPVYQRKKKEAE